jgi:hypothetical protein
MTFFSSNDNAILINNCANLENLTVTLTVTEDLITVGDTGFSMQVNSYPPAGQTAQGSPLWWFQYIIHVSEGSLWWEHQYWANASSYAPGQLWPPGYTPNPPNTTPWLPVFSNDDTLISFGSVTNNRILAGSVMQIALTTDSNANVEKMTFTVTDPNGNVSSGHFDVPQYGLFPIAGFELNVVSGPLAGGQTTFTSGSGVLTYTVSSGTLAPQPGGPGTMCGQSNIWTAEQSNAVYGEITPSAGSTLSQSLNVTPMNMEFRIEKDTFGQDEVTQSAQWGSAYWLAVSGFPNAQLGFKSPSDLTTAPSLYPTVTPAIDPALNQGLTQAQIDTIANNLPVVNTLGPLPVLAIDNTLAIDYQTFFYPFTVLFPNLNALNALDLHQVAVLTLSASLTVPIQTGGTTPTPVTVTSKATIELAKGEDPYLFNSNPADPSAYPVWLSFDLRLFKVTPSQPHRMFSVPNPVSTSDPVVNAQNATTYIQRVLHHLNHPGQITNGDTFDATLTQNEDNSAVEFHTVDDSGNPTFNFAVARMRLKSSITTTISPVRVFFRLFNAASTSTQFTEVGTGSGYYRWGSNGSAGHKIPLLGVHPGFLGLGGEYVTVPCFATTRVNLTQPADMKAQTDPPNAVAITSDPSTEVDTYFGCWLDINQPTDFLLPNPPFLQSEWDGPWIATESLNGAISVAPHQCLIAEIRFDDTPIPNGAIMSSSDKLAQRNIAWIDGPA